MALTSITKDFIVKSGLIVGTTATIKGDATLQAGLAVTGISTLSNAVYAGNTLQVTNDTTLQQGLRVTGINFFNFMFADRSIFLFTDGLNRTLGAAHDTSIILRIINIRRQHRGRSL